MLEHLGILGQDFGQGGPFLMELLLVLLCILDHVHVLGGHDKVFTPVAEELGLRHQVDVRLPERLVTKLVFVQQVQGESKLLPIAFFVL